jgi:hypothetical protein
MLSKNAVSPAVRAFGMRDAFFFWRIDCNDTEWKMVRFET